MLLVLNADDTRAEELRAIGGQLVATARRLVTEELGEGADEATVERYLATVRSWASGLDRATYEAQAGGRRNTRSEHAARRCRRSPAA